MIRLYNALTKKKEEYKGKQAKMYVCGITPYAVTHLGHAFTYVFFDTLTRYFRYKGIQTTYVQNVTDVDDDIIKKAKEFQEKRDAIVDKNTTSFLNDNERINIQRPDIMPFASEHIKEMLYLIAILLKKGFAYEKEGNVYFESEQWKNAGVFIDTQDKQELLAIANQRGNTPEDVNKKHPLDFVLWQKSTEEEPWWDSPYGKGRPGWHIECSAMIYTHLGETIDIHGGGSDLQFPHHAAEIAQSENATGKPLSQFWLHTAMVYYQKEKMSKSLGNLIFVSDLLKTYTPNAIRMLLLSHHYREQWEYTEEKMKEAEEKEKLLHTAQQDTSVTEQDFFDALDDDMNTPKALLLLQKLAHKKETLKKLGGILGLTL